MSVRPTLLREIRKTAAERHHLSINTGGYNRFSPLAPRDRSLSVGKRKLSDDTPPDIDNAPKIPRFDSAAVFLQLKSQDSVLDEVKVALEKFEKEVVLDDTVNPQVKLALGCLGYSLKLLLTSQRNLTSALIDTVKVSETSKVNQVNKATNGNH
jgi:hypothetical protein